MLSTRVAGESGGCGVQYGCIGPNQVVPQKALLCLSPGRFQGRFQHVVQMDDQLVLAAGSSEAEQGLEWMRRRRQDVNIDPSGVGREVLPCKTACKYFQILECAPAGGQIGRFELTPLAGLLEDGSHDEASITQRRVQAASC